MSSPKKSIEYYKELFKKIHENKYDYAQWQQIVPVHKKIPILCTIHNNWFFQTIANHARGSGCPLCRKEKLKKGLNKKPVEYFLQKAKKIHGEKYSYPSWLENPNLGSDTIAPIICPSHGLFFQKVAYHVDKQAGCPRCSSEKKKQSSLNHHGVDHPKKKHFSFETSMLLNDPEWLQYQHTQNQLTFKEISTLLNVQDTTVGRYFKKYNIPVLRHIRSLGEKTLCDFLSENDIEFEINNRTILFPREIDIYLPEYATGIEYCGLYWHSDLFKHPKYHFEKYKLCREKGIRLITIFEDEWMQKTDIVKNKLLTILNKNNQKTIYARKCQTVELTKNQKRCFFDQYHIQNNGPGSISYGLINNNIIVAAIIFIKKNDNTFILNRYATSCRVVGGFSKLLEHFKKNHQWNQIITFADLRWSNGNLYEKCGFKLDKILPPDYYYSPDGHQRIHKFNYRRKYLPKLLTNFDPNLSEMQNCDNNGILRIWDCGKLRFVLNNC